MSLSPRAPAANPHLGIYFGIFVSSLVCIVVLLLIFEQLGVAEGRLRLIITLGSIGLYIAIGVAAYTASPAEFMLSGRRVPAFFVGLTLAATAFGGTGLIAFAGAIFIAGLDALCVPVGIVAGFVAMAVLIAPFLRKFGAHTLPGYFGMRFQSDATRIVAAIAVTAPLVLILLAEVKMAVLAAGWLVEAQEGVLISIVLAAIVAIAAPGGVRSLTWSGSAQALTALIALLIPATIIAVMVTNLPLGQLSHGPVLRAVGRAELAQGMPLSIVSAFTFDLPGTALSPVTGRFATPFSSVGGAAYVIATLSIMMGVAASPVLLPRSVTAASVYETRKSLGWTVLLAGTVVVTLAGLAVFYRDLLMSQIAGTATAALPQSMRTLIDLGFIEIGQGATRITATGIAFRRDGTLLGLPILMGLPAAIVFLVAAGALAAALAGAAASLTQLGIILAEDVLAGRPTEPRAPRPRLMLARASITTVALAAGLVVALSRRDPFDLVLWAFALSAGALFPVLFLSIWWKRLTAIGAMAGLVAGFVITAITIVLGLIGAIPLPPELAALAGVPGSFAAAILLTLARPEADRHLLEMVRDLRVPSGEPVLDRELRLARQKRAKRTT